MLQEMAEPRSRSTYQVLLDKHGPGGAAAREEIGEHSEEYNFKDWGQRATGDRDKGESYLKVIIGPCSSTSHASAN